MMLSGLPCLNQSMEVLPPLSRNAPLNRNGERVKSPKELSESSERIGKEHGPEPTNYHVKGVVTKREASRHYTDEK